MIKSARKIAFVMACTLDAPQMPLTRHLYEEGEVVAALQYCVLQGRLIEAVFWCEELLYSSCTELLIEGLRRIWLYGFGIAALSWYRVFSRIAKDDTLDFDEMVGLVIWLGRLAKNGRRDISYLVLAGCTAPAEEASPCSLPKGVQGVDAYFIACVQQGRTLSAWRAFGSISTSALAIAAEHKHAAAGLEVCSLLTDYPALTVAALCLRDLGQRLAEAPLGTLSEIEAARAEWEPLLGHRARRFPIPPLCLYWLCPRGATTVYQTSEKILRGSLERPGKLWGSTYWDAIADDLGGWEAIRTDPEIRMSFYDTYFPDDIPDEWSTAEREKSHGSGTVQPGATPSAQIFLQRWFGQLPSSVIWNGFANACQGLSHAKSWVDIQPTSPPDQPLNLVLVRRVLCVGT